MQLCQSFCWLPWLTNHFLLLQPAGIMELGDPGAQGLLALPPDFNADTALSFLTWSQAVPVAPTQVRAVPGTSRCVHHTYVSTPGRMLLFLITLLA